MNDKEKTTRIAIVCITVLVVSGMALLATIAITDIQTQAQQSKETK